MIDRELFRVTDDQIRQAVSGKRIMITGAGGSIGSELVRLVARGGPAEIILLSHSEFSLYTIEKEISASYPVKLSIALADVRSAVRVTQVCCQYRPEIIFHAAAVKHVPLAEENPCEAILTNVIGTWNLISAAKACFAKRLVFISTDKAVEPTCVMGATKRAAEMICATQYPLSVSVVRFGNVIGSSGSVIPLFKKQIADGKPLTVTHPEVTRFFMSVPEAAGLIIQTLNIGAGLFVLDMGEPVNIMDLAKSMIRDAGQNISIEITGLRKGEKLHEKLFQPWEIKTKVGQIFCGCLSGSVALKQIRMLRHFAEQGLVDSSLRALRVMVPEYGDEDRHVALR